MSGTALHDGGVIVVVVLPYPFLFGSLALVDEPLLSRIFSPEVKNSLDPAIMAVHRSESITIIQSSHFPTSSSLLSLSSPEAVSSEVHTAVSAYAIPNPRASHQPLLLIP